MADVAVGLSMGPGNSVYIYAAGELSGAAVRNGRGWTVRVHGSVQHARDLDGVLTLLGLLPDHHARERR